MYTFVPPLGGGVAGRGGGVVTTIAWKVELLFRS